MMDIIRTLGDLIGWRNIVSKIISIIKLWVPTWIISVLFLAAISGAVFWSFLSIDSFEWSEDIFINIEKYLPLLVFLILGFLSVLLIVLRTDMGLIYFSPRWKPSGFDFEKKFIKSSEVWYMTTVGRFGLKEANIQQKIPEKDNFRCLLLDPWSKYFNERMTTERPKGQSVKEARETQLKYCNMLLSLKEEKVHVRWYNSAPQWRMFVYDRRYVAVGWFPDYSQKPPGYDQEPVGDENKGYNGPLLVLDRESARRNVSIKNHRGEKMVFPMSLLADAFIKYFEAVWESAKEDLNIKEVLINDEKVNKIISEKNLKTLDDVGIKYCWPSEKDSPYSFLSLLSEPNLTEYSYLA